MTNNIIFTKKIYMLQRTFPPLSPLLSLLSLPPIRRRSPKPPAAATRPTPAAADSDGEPVGPPRDPLREPPAPPAPLSSVQEFAVRTVPSASKVDIRRCLESMYGFSIAEVRTLNMEGKKRRLGPHLAAKPDYKKAYVTLRSPLTVSPDLFPIGAILGERERKASAAAARRKAVEGAEMEGQREGKGKHWMEDEREGFSRAGCGKVVYGNPGRLNQRRTRRAKTEDGAGEEGAKFPWTGMQLATEKPR